LLLLKIIYGMSDETNTTTIRGRGDQGQNS